ncbi:MAG: pilus assembly protein PilM [Candidatus Tumulicola sp.]
MSALARLPLGLDLGSSRVRLAQAVQARSGEARLAAIAVRDLPQDAVTPDTISEPELVAAIVEDLHREIGTRERRCVLSIGADAASLRWVRFPPMGGNERRLAARFEAERFAGWDTKAIASTVRVHPVQREEHVYAVGAAREAAIRSRIDCAKQSGLRPVGMDHDACALRRAFPLCDAVLDVGYRQAALHAFTPAGPISLRLSGGGIAITRAIAADLSIDAVAAEKRKRLFGTAGAGESARLEFTSALDAALKRAREKLPGLRRIAAAGNGSRLTGLAEAVATASGATLEMTVSDLLRGGGYPDDVIRAAAQDWALAASLAVWSRSG